MAERSDKIILNGLSYKNLPEPVIKYFQLALGQNHRAIKSAYLEHSGYFKMSPKNKWIKIKGKQHFTVNPPGFVWTGKTRLFKAIDKFSDGKGSLTVKLLSVIPIVKAHGRHVDQAELLRWLGESVWFPTNLLPGKNLKWSPVDSLYARLTYNYQNLKVFYDVRFNSTGEIIQVETERYMEKGKLNKWTGKLSDYKDFEGMKIPTHIEAIWNVEEGDFQYVDFYVDTIEYEYF